MKTRDAIRSAMRRAWKWHPTKKKVLAEARLPLGGYTCAVCGEMAKKVDIDHINPVGPAPGSRNATDDYTWDELISRLFCGVDNLRALCKPCHKVVTAAQRKDAADAKRAKKDSTSSKRKPRSKAKKD